MDFGKTIVFTRHSYEAINSQLMFVINLIEEICSELIEPEPITVDKDSNAIVV